MEGCVVLVGCEKCEELSVQIFVCDVVVVGGVGCCDVVIGIVIVVVVDIDVDVFIVVNGVVVDVDVVGMIIIIVM